MKSSIYNYIVENENKYIVFNTLSTSLIVLDEDKYNKLTTCIDQLTADEFSIFKENGFIVEDDIDEKTLVDFNRSATAFDRTCKHFRILTTTACNARCHYCYESGVNTMTMDNETADAVIEYIKDKSKDAENISIAWFGGEPMLNHKVIDKISAALIEYSNLTNKEYKANITSNGSLFTEELVEKASTDWKIGRIQITLDGVGDTYNKIKAYVDNSSFDKVISNIKLLTSKNIYVSIRLNYDKNNYDSIKELIEYLFVELKDCKHWGLYVYPVFNNRDSSYDEEYVQKLSDLNKIICKYSTNPVIELPQYREGSCVFASMAGETVMPNGDLLKCCRAMHIDKPFGNVKNPENISYNTMYARWVTPILPEKCNNCVKLPLCQGGCKAERMLGFEGCTPWMKVLDQTLLDYVNL